MSAKRTSDPAAFVAYRMFERVLCFDPLRLQHYSQLQYLTILRTIAETQHCPGIPRIWCFDCNSRLYFLVN